jgi:tRNA threonylcarbamoyladenosine biosynthesis protein TsaE
MVEDSGTPGDAGAPPSLVSTDEPGPPGTVVVRTATPDGTKRVGAVLARFLRPGDTVLLGGELGAGKTTLTQGLAAALGVGEAVTSPTFVLVHSYKTAAGWGLLHADVWRLQHLQEVIDLALPELLEDGAAAVIEWGDIAAPALAPDWLHVAITYDSGAHGSGAYGAGTYDPGPDDSAVLAERRTNSVPAPAERRRLQFRAFGPSWQSRLAELSVAWAALNSTAGLITDGARPSRTPTAKTSTAKTGTDQPH